MPTCVLGVCVCVFVCVHPCVLCVCVCVCECACVMEMVPCVPISKDSFNHIKGIFCESGTVLFLSTACCFKGVPCVCVIALACVHVHPFAFIVS